MFARWRIVALLTLLITVIWAVGPVAAGSTWAGGERMSQAGEIGTLPARRSEGPSLDPEEGDDGPANPPTPGQALGASVGELDLTSPHPGTSRSIERFGSTSPRGPPSLVLIQIR